MHILRRIILLFPLILVVRNWFSLYIHLFLNPSGIFLAHLKNKLKFYVRLRGGDTLALVEDFYYKQYFSYEEYYLKKNAVVIDAGAHIGTFSIFVARQNESARIFAYEPDSRNYDLLVRNIKINNIKNISPIAKAIWKHSGKMKIYISKLSTLGSSLVNTDFGGSKEVKCVSLEGEFSRNNISFCDFLKLDIEGAEYDVLYSLNKDFYTKVKALCVECHDNIKDGYDVESLKRFFEGLGYSVSLKRVGNEIDILFAHRPF